jgi:hypothetical protein
MKGREVNFVNFASYSQIINGYLVDTPEPYYQDYIGEKKILNFYFIILTEIISAVKNFRFNKLL